MYLLCWLYTEHDVVAAPLGIFSRRSFKFVLKRLTMTSHNISYFILFVRTKVRYFLITHNPQEDFSINMSSLRIWILGRRWILFYMWFPCHKFIHSICKGIRIIYKFIGHIASLKTLIIVVKIKKLRSGAIPNAITLNGWDWELKKVTFNFNHWINKLKDKK